jgi:hypothetical protein
MLAGMPPLYDSFHCRAFMKAIIGVKKIASLYYSIFCEVLDIFDVGNHISGCL